MKSFPQKTILLFAVLALPLLARPAFSQDAPPARTNRADRLDWFRDQGFGLFIHWSLDSQLGVVISHSMVGASDDYLKRFVGELPQTFNPHKFRAGDLAVLAKLAGVRYVVFTAKHHSGFCMFDTKTTPFNILNTPFQRDITAELLQAFRDQGIAPGLYFSPDDFWWLYTNGRTIQRRIPEAAPVNNPNLMAHDLAQVRELLTHYGPIRVVFFDGPSDRLRDLAWELQPDTVITRGAMQTPEKTIPGKTLDVPWEACITMGDGWQYQPTLENYKSAGRLIEMLIEIRAKGGNLLLNVGPKPDGELPMEQEERLREIAEWMFVNGEAIYGVRPWVVANEQDVWFTRQKNADTVYAFVKPAHGQWKLGETRDVVLASVRATDRTQVSVLGQNDRVLEYQPAVPKTTWQQQADGLHVHFMQAQRLRDNRTWPNPVVLKITGAQPVQARLRVETVSAQWDAATAAAQLVGQLAELAGDGDVQVGFQYRDITGQDTDERTSAWIATDTDSRAATGPFTARVSGLKPGHVYETRALAKQPSLTLYGREISFRVP